MTPSSQEALLSLSGHNSKIGHPRRLLDWLADNASCHGERNALEAPQRPPLSHQGLFDQVAHCSTALTNAGLGRGDVVLVLLPNGPEALSAILSVSAVAVAFPLALEEPYDVLIDLLQQVPVKAVLFDIKHPGRAIRLSKDKHLLSIPINIDPAQAAGSFSLAKLPQAKAAQATHIDDGTILTRTAGTSSQGRIIIGSQASLYRAFDSAAKWMELTATDRSLCVMPFNHLHSLWRSSGPGLLRGGSVVCCPGFNKQQIFDWFEHFRPSYMTAVPAIWHSILEQANVYGKSLQETSLRQLITGSDKITQASVQNLAHAFDLPVKEFYGMSEVSPMLAASSQGMQAQYDGVIGKPLSDWRLEVRDEMGQSLPTYQEGEIVACGGLINPILRELSIPQEPLTEDWYHTGDQGFIDDSGLLHITGRIDERITRGGEKISPGLVEKHLENHPSIQQAIVFPLPDPILGERVAALVRSQQGETPKELELRGYLAEHMANFMVPERILVVESIPSTTTGKLSRKSLAAHFQSQLSSTENTIPEQRLYPRSPTEESLLEMVQELLEQQDIPLQLDFMQLGGDSFLAMSLLVSIEERFGILPSPGQFLQNSSIEKLAILVEELSQTLKPSLIETLQIGDNTIPLFFSHGLGGNAYYARTIVQHLDSRQTVYAFNYVETNSAISPDMTTHAALYCEAIKEKQAQGPYLLAGYSFGAHLAFEVARQLAEQGDEIAFLGLIDDEADLIKRKFDIYKQPLAANDIPTRCQRMIDGYVPLLYPGDIELFIGEFSQVEREADSTLGWGELSIAKVNIHDIPGDHSSVLEARNIEGWAGLFKERINLALKSRSNATDKDWQERRARVVNMSNQADIRAIISARISGREGNLQQEINSYKKALDSGLNQPYWVYRNLADCLLQKGEIEASEQLWLQGIEREELPVVGNTLLANVYHRLEKKPLAYTRMEEAEKFARESAVALVRVAENWFCFGRPVDAERCAKGALELNPDNPIALMILAKALTEQGQFAPADKLAQQATTISPNNMELLVRHAELLQKQGNLASAGDKLQQVLKMDGTYPDAHRQLSNLYQQQGELEEAIQAIQMAIKFAPKSAEFKYFHSTLLLKQKQFNAAESTVRQAIQIDNSWPELYHQLSTVLDCQGRHENAIQAIRSAIKLTPKRTEFHYFHSTLLLKQNESSAAESAIQQAIQLDDCCVEFYRHLSAVLNFQGRLKDAIQAIRHAINLAPDRTEFHYFHSSLLLKQNELSAAKSAVQQALQLDNGWSKLYRHLSAILKRQGQLKDAIAAIQKAIELTPERTEYHYFHSILLLKQNKLSAAESAVQIAIQLDNSWPELYCHHSAILNNQKRLEEAIQAIGSAIELAPERAEFLLALGQLYIKQKDLPAAEVSFRQAIKLDFYLTDAHRQLSRVLKRQQQP